MSKVSAIDFTNAPEPPSISRARPLPELKPQIITLRRKRKSYAQIVAPYAMARAAVWRVLKRHRFNHLNYLDPVQTPPVRYEGGHTGELVHRSITKLGRIVGPGAWITGQRADRSEGAGMESVHVAIDDRSRLGDAYVLTNERPPATSPPW